MKRTDVLNSRNFNKAGIAAVVAVGALALPGFGILQAHDKPPTPQEKFARLMQYRVDQVLGLLDPALDNGTQGFDSTGLRLAKIDTSKLKWGVRPYRVWGAIDRGIRTIEGLPADQDISYRGRLSTRVLIGTVFLSGRGSLKDIEELAHQYNEDVDRHMPGNDGYTNKDWQSAKLAKEIINDAIRDEAILVVPVGLEQAPVNQG